MRIIFAYIRPLISSTILLSSFMFAPVFAQAQDDPAAKAARSLPGISEAVFKSLGKVTEFTSPDLEKKPDAKPNFKSAYKELKSLEKKCDECNNYEKSQIYNMFAYVTYSEEKYDEAIDHYKKVVSFSPEIPIGLELQSMMYVAQLSFQQEKYDQAIDYLERNMKLSNDTGNEVAADLWQLKSLFCYQGEKKKCALDSIDKAVGMIEARKKIADESWYNLQRSLYLDKEDYKTATKILEKMLRHYPKKLYWNQIGSMYGLLERDKDQINAMAAAYEAGALTKEKDLINLSYLLIAEEVPARAAKILEKGMKDKIIRRTEKNLDTLSIALMTAKEVKKAVPVLKELADMSDSGNYYGQLVGLNLDLNQPKEAIKMGKLALKKGKFTKGVDGEVYINMGIAYADIHQYENAVKSFREAKKIKKYARFSESWLRFAEAEQKRYEGLKRSLASVDLDIEKVMQ